MLATQFATAIENAPFHRLAALGQDLWKAFAAGHLDEAQTQALSEQLEARKPKPTAPTSFRPPKAKAQRSPDKQASIERRRRLARASPVPPELVDKFTQSEHAVITVITGEIQRCGACAWPHAKTAALAGTCRTIVKTALRKARDHALLFVKERRRRGQKSLTNIVSVLRQRWGAWLRWIGGRKTVTTAYKDSGNGGRHPVEVPQCGLLAGSGLRGGP